MLLIFLGVAMAAAAETNCTPRQALESFKQFTLSDGASYYRFAEDGTFKSGPMGMSGRELNGTWKTSDGERFIIVAKVGWMNGLNLPGDYRRIVFHISHLRKQTPKTEPSGGISIGGSPPPEDLFQGYWFIDEFVKTEKPKGDETKAK